MKVGLFVPCYVNAIFPEVGMATYKLLKYFGLELDYPENQTCCGQPMANGGFEDKSTCLAKHFDEVFKQYDYIVSPSSSCTLFVKDNHPVILEREGFESKSSGKIYDLCEFLHDILKVNSLPGKFPHRVSIHNSCHGVRKLELSSASELNITRYSKIKDLLQKVEGLEIFEPTKIDECCGFGGMFAIEEPDVSVCMGQDKVHNHINTGAEYITGADSSCLMHMEGIVNREKLPIKFIHVSQILAAGL